MGPIRGQTRPVPVTMDIVAESKAQHVGAKLDASIHNRFDIEIIDSETGEVRQRAQAENVICNNLWACIGTAWNNYIAFGTGSGTPTATDTSLFTHLGIKSSSQTSSAYDSSAKVYSIQKMITLSETEYIGSTPSEVGIAYGNGPSYLATHAMIKDMNGNAITISKTGTDIIRIYATVFVHINNTISAATLSVYNNNLFKMLAGIFATQYKSCKCSPFGISKTYTMSVSAQNKSFTLTADRVVSGECNGSGIFAVDFPYLGFLICAKGAPWCSGSEITAESVGTGDGVKKDFSTAFHFAKTGTVYVNGVADASVTFDDGLPAANICNVFLVEPPVYVSPDNTQMNIICDEYNIYKNPFYATTGILKIDSSYYFGLSCTDDEAALTDLNSASWSNYSTLTKSVSVGDSDKNKKYWKISNRNSTTNDLAYMSVTTTSTGNIHFPTAPATGAVITSDYHTDVIAKDVNHVFDFSLAFQLGEYTG